MVKELGVAEPAPKARAGHDGGLAVDHPAGAGPRSADGETDLVLLTRRMFSYLERLVANLETADMSETGEKETTVMGRIVSAYDKLIEIHGRNDPRKDQGETREMADLRNKLARRIDRLKKIKG